MAPPNSTDITVDITNLWKALHRIALILHRIMHRNELGNENWVDAQRAYDELVMLMHDLILSQPTNVPQEIEDTKTEVANANAAYGTCQCG